MPARKRPAFDPAQPAPPPDIAQPRFQYTPLLVRSLSVCDLTLGFLVGVELDPEWQEEIAQEARLLEAHFSTAIEGTQLTLEESRRILAGEDVMGISPDSRRELINYWQALERVGEYCKTDRITEKVILQIHKDLVQGVRGGHAQPGMYRQDQNRIVNDLTTEVVFTPPAPAHVKPLMGELVRWTNAELASDPPALHPVLLAGIAQFWFLHIHPFLDGNGRTARLLSTLILLAGGNHFAAMFPLSVRYDQDKNAYYRALQGVREAGLDLTGWLEYFAARLAEQMADLQKYALADKQLSDFALEHGLNRRQLRLLRVMRREPRLRIRDLQNRFPEIPRRTLQHDLNRLETLKVIQPVGATTQQFWEYIGMAFGLIALGHLFGADQED